MHTAVSDFGSHQIPETTKQMLDENFEKFEVIINLVVSLREYILVWKNEL